MEMDEEIQYLNIVRKCIESGTERTDRTGNGTRSLFGEQMRFSLRDNRFPLLTTKRVYWKGVVEELLWFIRGSTDAKDLSNKGVHIWDANGTRDFLDNRGLTNNEVGDLGPIYSFQWRHSGAKYIDCHTDYTGQGIDQLQNVIDLIRKDPTSRRIIMSAWNPADIQSMALPPCHALCQFYVANDELSCMMYQRSADLGLGVPFNIASYALLTRILAHITGYKPGEFIHIMGDCHVYLNHINPLTEQLKRTPKQFPRLIINTQNKDINSFKYEDFQITDYNPHSKIDMQLAV